jgi:hypothetical protein
MDEKLEGVLKKIEEDGKESRIELERKIEEMKLT